MVLVDAATFGAKFKTKREVYRFLTHDCSVYLSSYETMTIYHMKDLAASKRRRISQLGVKVITVPHFDGLKIETMLEYANMFPHVMEALPSIRRE